MYIASSSDCFAAVQKKDYDFAPKPRPIQIGCLAEGLDVGGKDVGRTGEDLTSSPKDLKTSSGKTKSLKKLRHSDGLRSFAWSFRMQHDSHLTTQVAWSLLREWEPLDIDQSARTLMVVDLLCDLGYLSYQLLQLKMSFLPCSTVSSVSRP